MRRRSFVKGGLAGISALYIPNIPLLQASDDISQPLNEQQKVMKQIGNPLSRLEGTKKVSGIAKYAGEYNVPELLYGYVVNSSITKGKILQIHTDKAMAIPGVIKIFTHKNRPSLAWFDKAWSDQDAPHGSPFRPLHDDEIKYNGQPIALVIAETFEQARQAAAMIKVDYDKDENFITEINQHLENGRDPKGGPVPMKPGPPPPTGDFEAAFKNAAVRSEMTFHHSTEHHNPLELYATTTVYEGEDKLLIYDKTQSTVNCQQWVCNIFGLNVKNVTVVSPYVGGGFGSGLRPNYQLFMSVLAALDLKRHVRVTLDRSQMFSFGHRPKTVQYTRFAADQAGTITAIGHSAFAETSQYEDYTEVDVNWSLMLYPAKNTLLNYKVVPADIASPVDMRAPGGSTGLHAIESTVDDLAYQLKMDPLELRLKNYTLFDIVENKPYSSKELKACYLQGAEKFGWKNRNPVPRSVKRGNKLVGYGMATGIWDALQVPASAEARITRDGKLQVKSAVTDIGVGSFTVMTQIAADQMGMRIEDVTFDYGNSQLPDAPMQGGSFTTSSVGTAVAVAIKALKNELIRVAKKHFDVLIKAEPAEIAFNNGNMIYKGKAISFKELIRRNNNEPIKVTETGAPDEKKVKDYSLKTHSAVFVEVEVDEELGIINVTRAVTAIAAGKIINPKTARSQILGGMVWGISKALREESIMDENVGKYINQNLGEYHIPVHADIHDLDVIFVEENDSVINDLGIKGVGEIGLIGMPPAITNAIFNATGKRVNDLPVHFEKLL